MARMAMTATMAAKTAAAINRAFLRVCQIFASMIIQSAFSLIPHGKAENKRRALSAALAVLGHGCFVPDLTRLTKPQCAGARRSTLYRMQKMGSVVLNGASSFILRSKIYSDPILHLFTQRVKTLTPCFLAYFFSATLPRSQIGRKMPSARISTRMPSATIRIGSICDDSVFSS